MIKEINCKHIYKQIPNIYYIHSHEKQYFVYGLKQKVRTLLAQFQDTNSNLIPILIIFSYNFNLTKHFY